MKKLVNFFRTEEIVTEMYLIEHDERFLGSTKYDWFIVGSQNYMRKYWGIIII